MGKTFDTGGNVNPIPVYTIGFFHHVAQVNSNPKGHPLVIRLFRILGLKLSLNRNRAFSSIYNTSKLGKQVVARRIHYTSMVLLNESAHQHFAVF
jgi:hypothetical protein